MYECVCVWYKYNITLYNLIIRKYYYMCVHCYHAIITVCYKVSNSKKKKKKKKVDVIIVQAFN